MKSIFQFFKKPWAPLAFGLGAGLCYFVIVLKFILDWSGSQALLLGFFFFPAIVCGMALVLVKSIKKWQEEENIRSTAILFWLHVFLLIAAVVFGISMILS